VVNEVEDAAFGHGLGQLVVVRVIHIN